MDWASFALHHFSLAALLDLSRFALRAEQVRLGMGCVQKERAHKPVASWKETKVKMPSLRPLTVAVEAGRWPGK